MRCLFQTERLLVRTYNGNDQENFFLLNGDPEVVRFIRPAKTREECDRFLREVMAAANATPLYGRWAVQEKTSNAFVGSFAVIPVENSERIQLGYALLRPYWGKGYATELTAAGLDYVFTKTDLDVIYGYTEIANLASQKVLLKSGFHFMEEKKEGEKELVVYALRKEQYKPVNLIPSSEKQ
ncbi:MAG TPA: GNAT family N-acetyltransferase [Flavisolibacter sp.]|nr:GNAT family N-acetyltransferase [Flavisolibacter sp.]